MEGDNVSNDGLDRSCRLERGANLSGPLSWYEARRRLMDVLEKYLREPFIPAMNTDTKDLQSENLESAGLEMKLKRLSILGLHYNLDIIFGSVLFSLVLLILSSQATDLSVERIVASVLLVLTSLTSVFINFRWKSISSRDGESKKRRIISNFLLEMRTVVKRDIPGNLKCSSDTFLNEEQPHEEKENLMNEDGSAIKINLNGTSLSDVYTVYRLPSTSKTQEYDKAIEANENERGGEWHRVPSLLLVQGDYIALQIGDVAPAFCESINFARRNSRPSKRFSEPSRSINKTSKTLSIHAKEKVPSTLNLTGSGGFANLPPGKSRLPNDSKVLMQVTGNMQVFQLKETPIDAFLHSEPSPQKTTQIQRQLKSIRIALFCFSTVMLLLSACILLIREKSQLFKDHQLLSIIVLAALGVLPVTTPTCALLLEVFGTSKILTAVHLHAFEEQQDTPAGDQTSVHVSNKSYRPDTVLFWKYACSTILSRLEFNLRKRSIGEEKKLLEIPPASSHLFERLGVVNALALVDDELACEPFSTPERLLLPSGGGAKGGTFKLLDLCPYYGDDDYSTDQEPTEGNTVEPGSNVGSTFLSQRRKRKRKGKRKRTLSSFDDSSLTPNDHINSKGLGSNSNSDDSDSDGSQSHNTTSSPSRRLSMLKRGQNLIYESWKRNKGEGKGNLNECPNLYEVTRVQFEDPSWWQHLPSLKCIGLACLLVDNVRELDTNGSPQTYTEKTKKVENESDSTLTDILPKKANNQDFSNKTQVVQGSESGRFRGICDISESHLVHYICQMNERNYLRLLSDCIGFSTEPNSMGPRGDISSFVERKRIHVIDTHLSSTRALLDRHAIGLEESRRHGVLRPDSTSVLIEDSRSKSLQLLTLGDARVVTQLCSDQWQGDTLTITPLRTEDRRMILDTATDWSLSDLEVSVFAYVPVPVPSDQRFGVATGSNIAASQKQVPYTSLSTQSKTVTYLLDNRQKLENLPLSRHKVPLFTDDWSLVENQIFLGLLGSSISSRNEIAPIISMCTDAGVRFVYFSPRNMKRTKELAAQMGIDVAWNCAISLRPLDEGEQDPHRMSSAYADWVTNARLPHGIENVKKHLEEVDNVPLLVSLYTDVTKQTTAEMVHVFQQYHDTVLALGVSHISSNAQTFGVSDISIGIDFLVENVDVRNSKKCRPVELMSKALSHSLDALVPNEITFVSSIASHACALNLTGSRSLSHIPSILAQGRSALEAGTSAGIFIITGHVSFSFFVIFSTCTASTIVPFVPILGSVLYLLVLVPMIGLSMFFTIPDSGLMERVPPKNDESITFGTREQRRLYLYTIYRALPPAIYPHMLYLIALGESFLKNESQFLMENCFLNYLQQKESTWVNVIRCQNLSKYSGNMKYSLGALILGEMAIGITILSSSFVFRTKLIKEEKPWKMSLCWKLSIVLGFVFIFTYLSLTVTNDLISSLPWYFYVLSIFFPILCLIWSEFVKSIYQRHETRAERFRRLQFETRLGMWSPK